MSIHAELTDYTSKGWRIISDGPTGVQLEGPKKMKSSDQLATILGIVLLFLFWPVGLLLLFAAMFDYVVLTKPETKFIAR